jgi:hypothetical protein
VSPSIVGTSPKGRHPKTLAELPNFINCRRVGEILYMYTYTGIRGLPHNCFEPIIINTMWLRNDKRRICLRKEENLCPRATLEPSFLLWMPRFISSKSFWSPLAEKKISVTSAFDSPMRIIATQWSFNSVNLTEALCQLLRILQILTFPNINYSIKYQLYFNIFQLTIS